MVGFSGSTTGATWPAGVFCATPEWKYFEVNSDGIDAMVPAAGACANLNHTPRRPSASRFGVRLRLRASR